MVSQETFNFSVRGSNPRGGISGKMDKVDGSIPSSLGLEYKRGYPLESSILSPLFICQCDEMEAMNVLGAFVRKGVQVRILSLVLSGCGA